MKAIVLNTWNKETMYWQSDKSDFVMFEKWNEEEHNDTDLQNAIEKHKEANYLGTVEMIDINLGADDEI